MRLLELFDKSNSWEWLPTSNKPTERAPRAGFKVQVGDQQREYVVTFGDRNSKSDSMYATFEMTDAGVPMEVVQAVRNGELKLYEVVFAMYNDAGVQQISLTGTGGELQVLSTVMEIVRDFIQKKDVGILIFSADMDEPSRVKLYDRMAKKFGVGGSYRVKDGYEMHYYVVVK